MDSAKRPPVSLNSARADCQEPIEILTRCGMCAQSMTLCWCVSCGGSTHIVPGLAWLRGFPGADRGR